MLRAVGTPRDNGSKAAGNRMAFLGTSLIQQNHFGATNSVRSMARGWFVQAMAYSKGIFKCPVWQDSTILTGWEPSGVGGTTRYFQGLNFGVSGQTIDQIVARVPYIIANYIDKFDIIVIDGGTNDMAGALTKEYIQSQREWLVDQFLAYGKRVVLLPILSRSTSVWASGGVARKQANWINAKSREFAKKRNGVFIYDWNKAWTDFTTADGTPYAARTGDGTHFDVEGGDYVGEDFANWLKNVFPAAPINAWSADNIYDATYNERGSILPINPFLLGATAGTNGTGSSGTVISGGTVERASGSLCTVVNSIAAKADGRGNNQVLTFTMGGTTDEIFYFRTNPSNTTHNKGGKWVLGRCEIETNASDQIYGITLFVEDQAGSKMSGQAFKEVAFTEKGSLLSKWATKTRDQLLETPAFILDAASTTIRWRVEITVRGGGSVAPIIKIGCVELIEVDDPRT